jgi:hypothetical protein
MPPATIRALELAAHTLIRLGANLTSRRSDEFDGFAAFEAEILSIFELRATASAVCGKEKRNNRIKKGRGARLRKIKTNMLVTKRTRTGTMPVGTAPLTHIRSNPRQQSMN